MRTVCFKIEERLLKQLDKYAAENNMNRSEVIRKAIEMLIKSEKRGEG